MTTQNANYARLDSKNVQYWLNPTTYDFKFSCTYTVGVQTTVSGVTTLIDTPNLTVVGTASYTGNAANISWGADNDSGLASGLSTVWTALKSTIISQENLNSPGPAYLYFSDGTLLP